MGVWEAVHTPSPISAFCGTVIGLGGLYSLQWWLHTASLSWDIDPGFVEHDIVTFVGAFGALSALLYGAPQRRLADQSNDDGLPDRHLPDALAAVPERPVLAISRGLPLRSRPCLPPPLASPRYSI